MAGLCPTLVALCVGRRSGSFTSAVPPSLLSEDYPGNVYFETPLCYCRSSFGVGSPLDGIFVEEVGSFVGSYCLRPLFFVLKLNILATDS